MPSKWAMEHARALQFRVPAARDALARALDAAYQEGERRGRERAAEVASAEAATWRKNELAANACAAIAADIRALPDEPPPEPRP